MLIIYFGRVSEGVELNTSHVVVSSIPAFLRVEVVKVENVGASRETDCIAFPACGNPLDSCVEKWGGNVVEQIKFNVDDTASKFYRAAAGAAAPLFFVKYSIVRYFVALQMGAPSTSSTPLMGRTESSVKGAMKTVWKLDLIGNPFLICSSYTLGGNLRSSRLKRTLVHLGNGTRELIWLTMPLAMRGSLIKL
eukprot:sb/3471017/